MSLESFSKIHFHYQYMKVPIYINFVEHYLFNVWLNNDTALLF